MSGAEIAAEVAAALAEAGAELSNDGQPLKATVQRTSGADESTYPPTLGSVTDYTTTAIVSQYSARDRDGTEITTRDVKVMLAVPLTDGAGSTTEPQNGDTLELSDGRTLHLVNVMPLRPAGVSLMWTCQARAAE